MGFDGLGLQLPYVNYKKFRPPEVWPLLSDHLP